MNSKAFKQIFSLFLFVGIFLGISQKTFAQQKPTKTNKLLLHKGDRTVIPNQYIVIFNDEFIMPFVKTSNYKKLRSRDARAKALQGYKAETGKKILLELRKFDVSSKNVKQIYAGGIVGFTAVLTKAQVTAILKLKYIKWIELDGRFRIIDKIGKLRPIKSTQTVDWGVEMVGSKSGEGKYAFVLDTGVDQDHPDLNVKRNLSASMISSEPSKDDLHGHGSHVAGIIGAKNNFIGTKGVAAGAFIVGVKVLKQSGSGSWSDIIAGTSYTCVVGSAGDVANYSLGGSGYNWTLEWAIKNLLAAQGIYVTIAAGNNNAHANGYMPARVNGSRIFTISNMDSAKRITGTSNYGNGPVDYAAPGQSIYSCDKNGGYTTKSGTSMAAPHVAGIILVNNGTIRTQGTVVSDKDPVKDKIASVN